MDKPESNYNMIDWWTKVVLKNYANFTGRARRSEYWYFALCNGLMILIFYILAFVGIMTESIALSIVGGAVYFIIALATLVPSLAVAVRRLHDVNRSGWYYFIGLIPIVGPIILLVWFFTEGTRGQNNYGYDPKNAGEPEFDFDPEQTS